MEVIETAQLFMNGRSQAVRLPKLFRFEGMLVEGQMQKPNAFYVLQRAAIDYDFEALSESFLPRILAATHEPPF